MRHRSAKLRRQFRPAVDRLEERRVLSTFAVTSTLDDGSVGTLRWAVGQANTDAGADTIAFDPAVFSTAQTISLSGTQLELTDTTGATTIAGPAAGVTISGNNKSRVFRVDLGAAATISGLTITGGYVFDPIDYSPYAIGYGGGVENHGATTLENCLITANDAASGGAGVSNEGTIVMVGCTVLNNKGSKDFSGSGINGGGLFNDSQDADRATARLTDTIFEGNTAYEGGGISNVDGQLELTRCTFRGNSATNVGGGIQGDGTTVTTVTDCTFVLNTTGGEGGGIYDDDRITVTGSTFSGNSAGSGGGAALFGAAQTLTNSTFTGNTARSGGGLTLYPGGLTSLTNCTVSNNTATSSGAGLSKSIRATLGVVLNNTIVAGNTRVSGTTTTSSDIAGLDFSGANNLIGTGGSGGLVSGVRGNLVGIADPRLGPLQDNGGPTPTMRLLHDSPAIDAADPASSPATDQRGVSRPQGNAPDIGAYEFVPTLVTTPLDTVDAADDLTSLREAIAYANAHAGTDTITFAPAVFAAPQAIRLNGSALELTDTTGATTIIGPGQGMLTIDGAGRSRVIVIDVGAAASISGLTITGGVNDQDNGGGVANNGTTTLLNCTIAANKALAGGAGILNGGTIAIIGCTVLDNSASDGSTTGGGMINYNYQNVYPVATVTDTVFEGNTGYYGGGVANIVGQLDLIRCTFRGNTAPSRGAGIYNEDIVTATDCTFVANAGNPSGEGGGLYNEGRIAITGSTFRGNSDGYGGGAYLVGTAQTLTNCTFSGNDAGRGGGLVMGQHGTLTNCTISSNTATGSGGGLYRIGEIASLNNTIVAGNTLAKDGVSFGHSDITGTFSGSNNLIGDGGSGGLVDGVDGNIVGVTNPGLLPLADNGGPTPTIGLQPGSPAIDEGSDTLAVDATGRPLATDQRGLDRSFHGRVDIGAYEVQTAPVVTILVSPGDLSIAEGGTRPLKATRVNLDGTRDDVTDVVTWASASPDVATIGGDGVASGLGVGTAVVTASLDGVTSAGIGLEVLGFVVNSNADDGAIVNGRNTLRQAILAADRLPGDHTIRFDAAAFAGPQTIALTRGLLELVGGTGITTIVGPAAGLTVRGGDVNPVFNIEAGATAVIEGLTIAGSTGRGVSNLGTATLTNCTIAGNYGGVSSSGTLTMLDCTVADNSSDHRGSSPSSLGGAVRLDHCTATLTNCTISDNDYLDSNSAISITNTSTATLTNCTISGNSSTSKGAGIRGGGSSVNEVTLINTIVAGNSSDISGTVHGRNNLIGTGGSGGLVNGMRGNLVGVAHPGLGPLGDYGGPTRTVALLTGSPAINAGDDASIGSLATDQRGDGSPRIVGDHVDIGAFEHHPANQLQTVSFDALADQTYGATSAVTLVATASSNLPVSFTLISGPATLSGDRLTIIGAGRVVVEASQGGDDTYDSAFADQTLTVRGAPITITVNDLSRRYGSADPALTASYSAGFVNGDTPAVFAGKLSILDKMSARNTPVGTYAGEIVASLLSSSNYNVTFVAGSLTVTPAPLTITAADAARTYGSADPALTASYSGFVNGESVAVLGGKLEVVDGKADSSTPVGAYSGAFTASGLSSQNYSITYVAGDLTVTRAAQAIMFDPIGTQTYGASPIALPEVTTSGLPIDYKVLTGPARVVGNTLSLVGAGEVVVVASQAGDDNRMAAPSVTRSFAVSPAVLTITPEPGQVKLYGAAVPPLRATAAGFVSGDSAGLLTGALGTNATADSPAGTYAFTLGSLQAGANYKIVLAAAASFGVTPAPLTIRANPASSVRGQALPTLTESYAGFVNGDSPASLASSPKLATTATSGSPAGAYAIAVEGGASPNYTITRVAGTLTILPAPTILLSASIQKVRLASHKTVRAIVLVWNAALDAVDALRPANFRLSTAPAGPSHKSVSIAIRGIVYQPGSDSLTLITKQPLNPRIATRLLIKSGSLHDAAGNLVINPVSGPPDLTIVIL